MTGRSFQDRGSARALVVGGDSLVGAALQAHCLRRGLSVDVTSRRPEARLAPGSLFLDLAAPDFSSLTGTRHEVAFLCAAVTSMQACQAEPERTHRINVANTIDLMQRLAERGTHLVFISSSQVFDGEAAAPGESAATNPKNEYGRQKVAVEQAIERLGLPAAILRPTKVLADRPVGVFKGWFEALSHGKPVQAATNMALSPVMVADVANAAERLATGRHGGIWHLGASDDIVYFEAARLVAEMRGLPGTLVTGEVLTEAQVPAIYRHRHVALSCDKIARKLQMPVRKARDILETLFAGFPQPVAGGR